MKKLYVDTASPDEVKKYTKLPYVSGLTTNPALVAKHIDAQTEQYVDFIKKIRDSLQRWDLCFHLSVELLDMSVDGGVQQARRLHDELSMLAVAYKVPIAVENVPLIKKLGDGLDVNATCAITPAQAWLGWTSGARIVSIFYRRACDFYGSEEAALKNVAEAAKLMPDGCELICGSIRTADDVLKCWLAGATAVTAPPKVIDQLVERFKHEKSDEAIQQFEEAARPWRF